MERNRFRGPAIAVAVSAAIATYFVLSFLFFPAYFHSTLASKHPAPQVTSVSISPMQAKVGQQIEIRVSATNNGDDADAQTVSVAFPNITSAGKITVVSQDFLQRPILISMGTPVAANYSAGEQTVAAKYAAIEAQSWPWEKGKTYTLELRASPQSPGTFVILVKSVALPHNGQMANYPESGVLDQQDEYAQPYLVTVKNS